MWMDKEGSCKNGVQANLTLKIKHCGRVGCGGLFGAWSFLPKSSPGNGQKKSEGTKALSLLEVERGQGSYCR